MITWIRSELNAIVNALPTKQEYAAADNGRITKGAVMGLLARTYLYANDWSNIASICKEIIDGEYGTYDLFPNYEGIFLIENEYNEEIMLDINYIPDVRTWDYMRDAIPISQGARSNEHAPTKLVNDFVILGYLSGNNSGYCDLIQTASRFTYSIVYLVGKMEKTRWSITSSITTWDRTVTLDVSMPVV